jgi:hypothetical protein
MSRLSDIAVVRAPTAANAISSQRVASNAGRGALKIPARMSGRVKSVCSKRTNEA